MTFRHPANGYTVTVNAKGIIRKAYLSKGWIEDGLAVV